MPRAPKHCSNSARQPNPCWNMALPGQRNCADCGNSRWPTDDPFRAARMNEIPQETYTRIFTRDRYECQIRYAGLCTGAADDLDHVVPNFEGGDSSDFNLQAACTPCHRAKSSDEGHRAQGHKVQERQRLPAFP